MSVSKSRIILCYRQGNPYLPAHDQTPADDRGGIFGAEHGDGGGLQTHTNTEEKAGDEELRPGLADGGADGGQETKDGGGEDGTATSQNLVDRVRQPTAEEGTGDVGASRSGLVSYCSENR